MNNEPDAQSEEMARAEASDGHAQAVCRAIRTHLTGGHGLTLPLPIRREYDEWLALQ